MSDNWYIVGTNGNTKGPMDETKLIEMYIEDEIHSKTYIWNGETVNQWIPIMQVEEIYQKIKEEYIYQKIKHKSDRTSNSTKMDSVYISSTKENSIICIGNDETPNIQHDTNTQKKTEIISKNKNKINESYTNSHDQPPNNTHSTGKSIDLLNFSVDSDMNDLMANIKNGIVLRDSTKSLSRQIQTKRPPKRLKDKWNATRSISTSAIVSTTTSNGSITSEDLFVTDSKSSSLTNSIDRKLVTNLHQMKYDRMRTKRAASSYNNNSITPGIRESVKNKCHDYNSNEDQFRIQINMTELSKRTNRIRKRFGEVEVSSRNDHKANYSYPTDSNSLKFQERVKSIKKKIDYLTIKDETILNKIEQIFIQNESK